MTEIKTAAGRGWLTPNGLRDSWEGSEGSEHPNVPVVIVHGLTEAEVHEAAALLTKSREMCVRTAARVPRWTPITEAMPNNGQNVLLSCERYNGKPYTIIGAWVPQYFDDNCDPDNSEYCEAKDSFYVPEGWYEAIYNWDDYCSVAVHDNVTHWMPLLRRRVAEGEK